MWKRDVHARTCRCTPPLTCAKGIASRSLSIHQVWTQSGQRSLSYRWRGCLRHPIPGTCHVPWQAPAGIGVGQIRNLLNGDIEQRRPLVNRSTRSRDISFSKASRVRVGSGRAYSDFSLKPQKNSLRASRSLVTTSESSWNALSLACHDRSKNSAKIHSSTYRGRETWKKNVLFLANQFFREYLFSIKIQ